MVGFYFNLTVKNNFKIEKDRYRNWLNLVK